MFLPFYKRLNMSSSVTNKVKSNICLVLEVVLHSKTNFVKVVQNHLLFRKPLMLCANYFLYSLLICVTVTNLCNNNYNNTCSLFLSHNYSLFCSQRRFSNHECSLHTQRNFTQGQLNYYYSASVLSCLFIIFINGLTNFLDI